MQCEATRAVGDNIPLPTTEHAQHTVACLRHTHCHAATLTGIEEVVAAGHVRVRVGHACEGPDAKDEADDDLIGTARLDVLEEAAEEELAHELAALLVEVVI